MNLLFISRHVVPDDGKQMCITKASVVKWYPLNPNPGLRLGLTKKTKPALNERFASHWFSFMSIGNGIDPLPEAPVRKWGYRLGDRGKGWNVAFILAADSLPDVNHGVNTPLCHSFPLPLRRPPNAYVKMSHHSSVGSPLSPFIFIRHWVAQLVVFFLHSFFSVTQRVWILAVWKVQWWMHVAWFC